MLVIGVDGGVEEAIMETFVKGGVVGYIAVIGVCDNELFKNLAFDYAKA